MVRTGPLPGLRTPSLRKDRYSPRMHGLVRESRRGGQRKPIKGDQQIVHKDWKIIKKFQGKYKLGIVS